MCKNWYKYGRCTIPNCGKTRYCQRVDGHWRAAFTRSGSFQGSRLMMVLFCCSLLFSQDRLPPGLQNEGATLAYQDDNYIVGKLRAVSQCWELFVEAMRAGGHEINMFKSCLWIPGCDDVPKNDLPAHVQSLLQHL